MHKVKIRIEIQDSIVENCQRAEDIEGYVWERLLFDDGFSGADHYNIDVGTFRNLVLDVMNELIELNQ